MLHDIVDFRDFYATPIGRMVRRMIRGRIRALWPETKGLCVVGLGYATPYLGIFRGDSDQTFAFMPATLGVIRWPSDGGSLVSLVDESDLPLPDESVDRILVVHALECTELLRPMLREAWRVLKSNGRMIVIVPNRRGIWARLERTPFGIGRPYSMSQLSLLLRDCMFTPVEKDAALFMPPFSSRMFLSAAPAWEQAGRRWFPTFSGVVLVEASKQVYALPPGNTVKAHKRAQLSTRPAGPDPYGRG
ncbi:MAG: class I SAM-dependent methyltransferase [Rhodospirillales bacterium]|nr:class I SAM-dependent methyltransferase [Rhodospirillales bacterium]MCW8951912.1 class I SAM-dependent methyltransferase [Rhodospirillales bacterium]MCW8970589.1 class I SAM-dependent methyltransferase [Rhodospirillales bacterium]MCW9002655.1 class I SAM-dependent methyltransferase [Rhodospirillales bacterium]MCW9039571.1 class I SAM-dependent methyltransferase [Rhodospirillales bacterium]